MKVVVVAGTSSGVGKTSLSVGLMRALRWVDSKTVVTDFLHRGSSMVI